MAAGAVAYLGAAAEPVRYDAGGLIRLAYRRKEPLFGDLQGKVIVLVPERPCHSAASLPGFLGCDTHVLKNIPGRLRVQRRLLVAMRMEYGRAAHLREPGFP